MSVSMIKQIAGRSGRRNSEYAEGLATTLRSSDAAQLREALEAPPSSLSTPTAGLFPEFEHLEVRLISGGFGSEHENITPRVFGVQVHN